MNRDELLEELSYLKTSLSIEKNNKDTFCGATYAYLLYEIEKIEQQIINYL
jgi:hypothetical protein